MHFKKVRLSGFKSFVDPTELPVEPGLTGIVGPNGCGKSNVLEALRWAMGENSPKSMRGAGMEDVIFSGTDRRPARAMAEVVLVLDNSMNDAPAPYTNVPEIEVSRRIERDSGSAYRINGKEVRARDVQLLFADAATGSHSPALVGQGRIGALISAKPQDRRAILEEAAGVTGLHKRRKEAENRLRGAENNLDRLEDVMGQMGGQARALKRQAKQARRYRKMSGLIREAQAILLYLRWKGAAEKAAGLEEALRKAERAVAEETEVVSKLSRAEAEAGEAIPALRQTEAETGAALQRLTIERENLDTEIARRDQRMEELEARIEQIAADLEREAENAGDAENALAALASEKEALETTGGDSDEPALREALEAINAETNAAEEKLEALSQQQAAEAARRERLADEVQRQTARIARAEREAEEKQAALARLEEESQTGGGEEEKALAGAEDNLAAMRGALEQAEEKRLAAIEARDAARADVSEKRSALSKVEAEIEGLMEALASEAHGGEPLAGKIAVEPGFEMALGAALGDDLEAPEDTEGPTGWTPLGPLPDPPALPAGARPLTDVVDAPDVLRRRLALTGLVEKAPPRKALETLSPGQRLVSREGDMWRWDGYHHSSEAPTAAARRMAQRNRLQALSGERDAAKAGLDTAQAALVEAEDAFDTAIEEERTAKSARNEAEQKLTALRRELAAHQEKLNEAQQKKAALTEAVERITRDKAEAEEALKEAQAALEAPEDDVSEEELSSARAEVEEKRRALATARAEYDGHARAKNERKARLEALEREVRSWTERQSRISAHMEDLKTRRDEAREALAELQDGPKGEEDRLAALEDAIEEAEEKRKKAADELAEAEGVLAKTRRDLKEHEAALATAREERARTEAGFEAARERLAEAGHEIREAFTLRPEDLLQDMDISLDGLPSLTDAEAKLEKLKAERERLGAVNLRADQELEELTEQIAHLEEEKEDLLAAIARLRQAISNLNREGRERLRAAFAEVDAHFSELFTRLFGGGHAHLAMVESDDPLEAGLEIMASPPGKKLQVLSLLSGGEQALTATALIFAVFMTNPSPICVLDEVDAPLDDANVERFCDLLHDITHHADTRFMIVTHNAVTMARMDRLFGVTMAERGVSQIVSVDLERAEELREAI